MAFSQFISEILPEIHPMKKLLFLKPVIRSQIMQFSVSCYSCSGEATLPTLKKILSPLHDFFLSL